MSQCLILLQLPAQIEAVTSRKLGTGQNNGRGALPRQGKRVFNTGSFYDRVAHLFQNVA